MSQVNYRQCDGITEDGERCESVTQRATDWVVVNVRGERFDYCTPYCFRSFGVHLVRLFTGAV